ncbi:MAG TPA: potassium/proton antiporter [Candidatus Marinimicrobia bacterium]|nr:potassium/proton antiporter [Candidatus Neomarinimicrobiota bacterium]HRS51084.1 potassium/proton antiporter [Candidatus Neomarinimicrobiota bacterium]HRU92590.1 potassium/proton antiporter [Candidatus Neomarinimicrobiota bacterium]
MYFLIAILLIAAIYSTKITSKFGVPVLLLFLGIGMLCGSDVLNLIYFDNAILTQKVANIFLIFILFEGGFHTRRKIVESVFGPALTLATFGIALTAAILGLLIHFVMGLDLLYSFLIGSIISSTDTAAVFMIMRQRAIKKRISLTLEVESATNDPMAIMLTIVFIQIITGHSQNVGLFILSLIWQFGGGVAIGWLISKIGAFLFDHLKVENRGYYHVLSIAVCLLAYGSAEVIQANGIIAVFFTGYWLGNTDFAYHKGVGHFIEGISTFSNIAIFLLLGVLVFPKSLLGVWREGLLITAIMILVARPLTILICTLPFKFKLREKLFLMWGGIKGAVPIVLATYPAVYGIDENHLIFNMVFFAVFLSCLLQGVTLGWGASKLHLCLPARPKPMHSIELITTRKTDVDVFEIQLSENSRIAGLKISDLALPADSLIIAIIRDDQIIPPKGHTVLEEGDILFVIASQKDVDRISTILSK